MTRLNLMLLGVLMVCAMSVITSQHQARSLFQELRLEQKQARELETEYRQLQLEQGAWATHARIEDIGRNKLNMRVPDPSRVQVVPKLSESAERGAVR